MTRTNARRRRWRMGALCYALAFALLFVGADALLRREEEYSGTWSRIRAGGGVPQVLIVGNSHAFCSFAPSVLSQALGVDAAVLAASGLNSVGVTDSVEAALHMGTPEYLVVEANAYTFDYDSTAQSHKATALSHINGMPRLRDRVVSAFRQFGYEAVPAGAFQLLRSDLMWKRWKGGEPVTAADGSSLLNWYATGAYDARARQAEARAFTEAAVPSDGADPRNDRELRRLFSLAETHGVKVVIVKAPTKAQTQLGSDLLAHLEAIGRSYGETFLGLHDFHQDVAEIGLTVTDFYDYSHLNRSGAVKLTAYAAGWLGERMGRPAALGDVFAYGGERAEALDGGLWRYEAAALGEGVAYRFFLDGEPLGDWSDQNWVVLALEPAQAARLSVSLRRGGGEISFCFMTPNTCVFQPN